MHSFFEFSICFVLAKLTGLDLALLKAIAQKLIPGIPEGSRIALLQQTKLTETDEDDKTAKENNGRGSVLQEVIERATARSMVEQEIKSIHHSVLVSCKGFTDSS